MYKTYKSILSVFYILMAIHNIIFFEIIFHHQWLSMSEYWYNDGMPCPMVFSGHGLQLYLDPYYCKLSLTIFIPGGVFMHRLG